MVNWKAVKRDLQINREGIIVGAGIGAIAAYYVRQTGVDLMFALQSRGAADVLLEGSRLAPADMAFFKVLIAFVIIGAGVGYLIDKVIDPRR